MAAATLHKPDSDYLRVDLDDQVHVCHPDGTTTPIGHVASTRTDDACPEELRDDLSREYFAFLASCRIAS